LDEERDATAEKESRERERKGKERKKEEEESGHDMECMVRGGMGKMMARDHHTPLLKYHQYFHVLSMFAVSVFASFIPCICSIV